jgi:hypothetical protein
MQDFAPFTPQLMGALSDPQTPGRTATAHCAVGQPAKATSCCGGLLG